MLNADSLEMRQLALLLTRIWVFVDERFNRKDIGADLRAKAFLWVGEFVEHGNEALIDRIRDVAVPHPLPPGKPYYSNKEDH